MKRRRWWWAVSIVVCLIFVFGAIFVSSDIIFIDKAKGDWNISHFMRSKQEIIEEIEHKKIPGYARGGMEQIEYRSNRAIFELLVDIRDIDAYELNFDMRSKEEMLHDIETRGFWLYAVGCRGQIEVRSLQATAEVLADIRDIKLEKLKEEALK